MSKPKLRVLFVCTENVCRSPLAEALLRHHLQRAGKSQGVKVNSAGTRTSQPGARPDQRALKVAALAGVNLGRIRASRVTEKDLVRSDLVFAVDRVNLDELLSICPPEHSHKIGLLLAHVPESGLEDVPDPYYGNYVGFEEVFELIERAVISLIDDLPLRDSESNSSIGES